MNAVQTANFVTNLLESTPPKLATPLAKPWHYRRNGRYYLRLRTIGRPFGTFTVSLRTADRAVAMDISANIQRALAYFQLDEPEATWEQLRVRLLAIAQECLELTHGTYESDFAHSEYFEEMFTALKVISKRGDLTVSQHRTLAVGQSIMSAAHARLEGRPGRLVKVIDELNHQQAAVPQSGIHTAVNCDIPKEPLTWAVLAALYMDEHSVDLKQSSRDSTVTNHKMIGLAIEAIGLTDLRKHNREDMLALRAKLLEGRAKSTVNNLLAKLQAVMTWAVRTDKLVKQYTDKLKFIKGAESSRVAFTRDQVVTIMKEVKDLPESSWERWALSVLVVTGARVGEITYLTKADVRQVGGYWCVDINEDETSEGGVEGDEQTNRKSIKNKHSKRLVPLVDGALGFDLHAFLAAVEAGALPSHHQITPARGSQALNARLKKMLGDGKRANQTLHSLRHHVMSSMQAAGVPVVYAQATAGQSTGTVAYDKYGSGVPVSKVYETIKQALMQDVTARGGHEADNAGAGSL